MDSKFQYVSVPEAADMLGVTDGRVRQLLIAGDLEGHKLGEKNWAIPVVAVQGYERKPRGPRPKNENP